MLLAHRSQCFLDKRGRILDLFLSLDTDEKSATIVEIKQRFGLPVISFKAFGNSLGCIVIADDERLAALVALTFFLRGRYSV